MSSYSHHMQNAIKQMIALDPSVRPTFDTLLHTSRGTVFPESFYSFLHNYVSSVNDLPTPSPFSPIQPSTSAASTIGTHSMAPSTSSNSTFKPNTTSGFSNTPSAEPSDGVLPTDSDHRMERIWADYESVEPYLVPDTGDETVMDVKVDYGSSTGSSKPFQVCF
jgi:phosphoinositide-3-kinase, regulatory subunit 4